MYLQSKKQVTSLVCDGWNRLKEQLAAASPPGDAERCGSCVPPFEARALPKLKIQDYYNPQRYTPGICGARFMPVIRVIVAAHI